ncbi:OmpA family protein [Pendulispora albinea]|uniref:OmpA family protein n=1 Tax=Pendulispora albinea TaxID=2741071 RepID=A0ABZ2LNX1_9BACT
MKLIHLLGFSVIAGAVGCASTTPPSELVNARSAYKGANEGQASQLAPADVHAAKQTLKVAEHSFDENGDSDETKDIAYAAQRRAEYADVKARTAAARQQQREANAREQSLRDQLAKANANQLANTRQALENERMQREDAERRAREANSELSKIASVRSDARGLVISLSGSVLFTSGKSALLPAAKKRLEQVAHVLNQQDPKAKLRIEGYTDSTGSAAVNERLSQARADTVRSFLVSQGIAADRIEATGMGPSNPIADNTSAEGRANNRRVEIIVQSSKDTGGNIR